MPVGPVFAFAREGVVQREGRSRGTRFATKFAKRRALEQTNPWDSGGYGRFRRRSLVVDSIPHSPIECAAAEPGARPWDGDLIDDERAIEFAVDVACGDK